MRQKSIFVILFIIILLFFVTRLINISLWPIFTDEAIYIRWSQIGSNDPNWWFISLTDGKQPLFTWIMMILFKILPQKLDALIIGRLVSVLAGFLGLTGILLLSYEIFKSIKISFFSALLYLICPFTLLYDRLALYDSLVSALYLWSAYLAVLLVRRLNFYISLLLGLILGLGLLTKSSAVFAIIMLPFSLLFINFSNNNVRIKIIKWLFYVIISTFIAVCLYELLRISPYYYIVGQKNQVFVYPLKEWITHPLLFFWGNFQGLWDWLITYLSLPIFILMIIALTNFRKIKENIYILSLCFLPLISLSLFAKVLYPRFILFMTVPLLMLASQVLVYVYNYFGKQIIGLFLMIIIFFPSFWISYFIIINPLYAQIPWSDRSQLMDDWPAGGGIKEAVEYFRKASEHQKIIIFTDGSFGLLPYGLEIYLNNNANIKIIGLWPLPKEIPNIILTSIKDEPTYLVLNQESLLPGISWKATLLQSYQKGVRNNRFLKIYQFVK
jgi:4-amino-4-deoxy-L-arabinose transferase-like glycosyltransferase